MKGHYQFDSRSSAQRLVNVGCGRTVHPEWVNIDLVPSAPGVIKHNLCCGLPFADDQVDAIYHSHVLEHLGPEQGERMLRECYRVLRPGGILRIVVPDLEQIAKLYLDYHQRAWQGDHEATQRYEWIKLELIDQMVRCNSGGKMGPYLVQLNGPDAEFVRSRLGQEVLQAVEFERSRKGQEAAKTPSLKHRIKNLRERFALWSVGRILGRNAAAAFAESLFRNRGEIHRWMYDRYSLQTVCNKLGFTNFQVQSAESSLIPEFDRYQLDREGSAVRKPDSLFCECRKPGTAATAHSPSAAA